MRPGELDVSSRRLVLVFLSLCTCLGYMGVDLFHVQTLHGLYDLLQLRAVEGSRLREDQDLLAECHKRRDGSDPGFGGELLLSFGVYLREHDVSVLL